MDIESTGILIGVIGVWGPMSKQTLVENRYTTVELKGGFRGYLSKNRGFEMC